MEENEREVYIQRENRDVGCASNSLFLLTFVTLTNLSPSQRAALIMVS